MIDDLLAVGLSDHAPVDPVPDPGLAHDVVAVGLEADGLGHVFELYLLRPGFGELVLEEGIGPWEGWESGIQNSKKKRKRQRGSATNKTGI